jgi:sugar O-acyltransferase (sialic acid O-acetyltransferase NeuD family)
MAREARQYVDDLPEDNRAWQVVGFLDDNMAARGRDVDGLPILGGVAWIEDNDAADLSLALGKPASRLAVRSRIPGGWHGAFATIVHPSARIGDRVEIGEGAIIAPGAVLTTDLVVGRHVIVNAGVTLAHDDVLEDFATLAPRVALAGAVHVGTGADIGIGASVIQGVAIGGWSIIGAGAVVIDDVPSNVTVVGVPARVISERPPGWHEAS